MQLFFLSAVCLSMFPKDLLTSNTRMFSQYVLVIASYSSLYFRARFLIWERLDFFFSLKTKELTLWYREVYANNLINII